jgi:hypothetical protein
LKKHQKRAIRNLARNQQRGYKFYILLIKTTLNTLFEKLHMNVRNSFLYDWKTILPGTLKILKKKFFEYFSSISWGLCTGTKCEKVVLVLKVYLEYLKNKNLIFNF